MSTCPHAHSHTHVLTCHTHAHTFLQARNHLTTWNALLAKGVATGCPTGPRGTLHCCPSEEAPRPKSHVGPQTLPHPSHDPGAIMTSVGHGLLTPKVGRATLAVHGGSADRGRGPVHSGPPASANPHPGTVTPLLPGGRDCPTATGSARAGREAHVSPDSGHGSAHGQTTHSPLPLSACRRNRAITHAVTTQVRGEAGRGAGGQSTEAEDRAWAQVSGWVARASAQGLSGGLKNAACSR